MILTLDQVNDWMHKVAAEHATLLAAAGRHIPGLEKYMSEHPHYAARVRECEAQLGSAETVVDDARTQLMSDIQLEIRNGHEVTAAFLSARVMRYEAAMGEYRKSVGEYEKLVREYEEDKGGEDGEESEEEE